MRRTFGTIPGTLVLSLLLAQAASASAGAGGESVARADSLFHAGRFEEAAGAYGEVLAVEPENGRALWGAGEMALLENRLDDAEDLLRRAVEALPEEKRPRVLLAESLYRRDRFGEAAPPLRQAGREAFAEQLESFGGAAPYQITGPSDSTVIPFLVTDPLPYVSLRVNGREGCFLIDTGGPVLGMDPAFAESAGVELFGEEEGLFAGGARAMYRYGRADSIGLGAFTVKNVPVHVKPVRLPPTACGGGPAVGVIGTVLLYHFHFTLDYPEERLVLRRRSDERSERWSREGAREGVHAIPFWMAGDHFMVAWGTANGAGPFLFLVDTGLAGGGFTSTDLLIEQAGIELTGEPMRGMGGGGPVEIYPYIMNELTLGRARQADIRAFHGAFPADPDRWGFTVAGIISHGFFRPYALTFDFDRMRIYLVEH